MIISIEDITAKLVGHFDIDDSAGSVFKGHLTANSYLSIGSN